jgi:hypothetical protein
MGKEALMFVPTRFLPGHHDPWPEPDRRWRRVNYLLRHRRRPLRGRDDPLTREAWRFRRGLGRRGAAGRARLARRFPALAEAHAAYAAAEPLRRAELEARLLAGEDDAAVAAKTGLSPAGVAAFHSTFFEVRPHLKAGTYIATVVLRRRGRTGAAPDEHAAALKALAHELGGWVVDKLLALFRDPPVVPAALGGLDLEALRGLRDRVRTKALLLAETAPAAAAAPATWQWLAGRLDEAGGGAAGLGGGWGSVRAALDVVAGLSRGAVAAPDAGAAAGGDAQRPGGYGRRQAAVGRGRCARPALPA